MQFNELFDTDHTAAKPLLLSFAYPWEALARLKEFIVRLGATLDRGEYHEISPSVWVHRSAAISPSAHVAAPCIVGAETEVRHGAFLRGGVLIGANCVAGNSTELKNVILFDGVQAPHFNYAGDSILGYKAHLGAGAVTSNVKSDRSPVTVRGEGETIATGLKKFGALVGDFAEIGCNSVLNPGTVIGRNSVVYPLSCVRGVVPADCIWKSAGKTVKKFEK